jgi:GntR family transcriptional regulator/MocR family aminotransferase
MRTPQGQIWRHRFETTPAGAHLHDRIARMLLDAIRARVLIPGSPLPSSREFALELGVSRNTVTAALDRLVDAGVLATRARSGCFVHPDVRERMPGEIAEPEDALADLPAPDWQARFALHPSAQRNIAKPADWLQYPFPFVYGQIDPTLFPQAEWRECCERALRGQGSGELLADRIDRDDPLLIEQIRTRLLPRRGVWAQDAEILVTVGAQHALYLLADLLIRPGARVGIEDPGYPDARNIFELRRATLQPIPVDAQGLTLSPLLAGCDTVYLTPSHQCPTTVTMPIARRRALLETAAAHDLVLIEDDYEPESSHDGPPTPALKSLDVSGRVVYVGSLSKTLAPGIRLGYVVADQRLIAELRALRRLMLRHPTTFNQRALALFLADGHYDTLSRRTQVAFKARARALTEALARLLPDWRPIPATGGSAVWVTLPPSLHADEVAERLRRHGVLVESGTVFHAGGDTAVATSGRSAPLGALRLGYSSIPVESIEPGIAAIRAALGH